MGLSGLSGLSGLEGFTMTSMTNNSTQPPPDPVEITKSPTLVTTEAFNVNATYDWTDSSNVLSSNDSHAVCTSSLVGNTGDMRLVIGGSITGDNLAVETNAALTLTDDTYTGTGGSATTEQVRASDFGCAYATRNNAGDEYSYHIKTTGYEFENSIPAGSTINSITVNVEASLVGFDDEPGVDHMSITINYTPPQ